MTPAFHHQATISLLVQCLCIKLTLDNVKHPPHGHDKGKGSTLTQLQKYIPLVDGKTKTIYLNKLEKLGISLSPKSKSDPNSESQLINLDEEIKRSELVEILEDGKELLGRCVKSSSGPIKADAVKTQQTVTSVHKQNVSEKTEIENINLTNALNSSRSASRGTQVTKEVNPALNNTGDSVRSYFRTTAMEVAFLLDRANSKLPIVQDDLEYLKDKFSGWKFNVYEWSTTTEMNVATIFSIVSKNHVINFDIQDSLIETGFQNSWNERNEIDNIRLKLLKTIQSCAERKSGQIPEKTKSILTTFRRSSNCTDDMKKILWQIFKQNDNNLVENFKFALEDLKNARHPFDDNMEEKLDYLREQIVDEQRAYSLNLKNPFFQTLLEIMVDMDGHYNGMIRSKVAQLVDDYLSHSRSPALSSEQMETFVQQYKDTKVVWSEVNQKLFKISLVRSILSTVNKPVIDVSLLPKSLLDFLVTTSTEENGDKTLGAFTVISLGNLVLSNPSLAPAIPNVDRLACKILRGDAVDGEGQIYLSDDYEKSMKIEGGECLTYISSLVANTILQSQNTTADGAKMETLTLKCLMTGLTSSPDKNTRIICSECIFKASLNKENRLNPQSLWELQPATTDPVTDVRIYSTAAYCTFLSRQVLECGPGVDIHMTSSDMDDLMQMYALEKLDLGGTDYTSYVNTPVLEILANQSAKIKYSNELFQHLLIALITCSQSQDFNTTLKILEIIYAQISTPAFVKVQNESEQSSLPENCLAAVENIFLGSTSGEGDDIFNICTKILVNVTEVLGQNLSQPILEQLYKKMQTLGEYSTDTQELFLRALLSAILVQDVSAYIFRGFDLAFVSNRLMAALGNGKSDSFYVNFTPRAGNMEKYKSNLLETIEDYLAKGSTLTASTFELLDVCLTQEWNLERTLVCLRHAAENGQTLPRETIHSIFIPSRYSNKIYFQIFLSITQSILQNNQNVPKTFLELIVSKFCANNFKTIFGKEDEDVRIFSILTNCLQRNQPISQLSQLVSKFCVCWEIENGGNHRQRMEILASLSALVNCGEETEDLDGAALKQVFLEAIQDRNGQILETGLDGFLALSTTFKSKSCSTMSFCNPSDVKLLVQIQRAESSSNSVKLKITDFLQTKKKSLSAGLRASINLSNVENKTNQEFLIDLPNLLKLEQDDTFFLSRACQEKISTILETEQELELLNSTMDIFSTYPDIDKLPISTMESIAFALVNKSDIPEFLDRCQKLLFQAIQLPNFQVSLKLIRNLEADSTLNAKLLLEILSKTSNKNGRLMSAELEAALQIQSFIENNKLKESILNDILKTTDGTIQLDQKTFDEFLKLKFIVPGLPKRTVSFISDNILVHGVPQDKVKVMGILETILIKKDGQIPESVLEAFIKVLSKEGELKKPKECIEALMTSWTNSKSPLTLGPQSLVLMVMAEIFKTYEDNKSPFVPCKSVQWLTDLVQSPISIIRKLTLRALNELKPESVINLKSSDQSGLMKKLASRALHFFKPKKDKEDLKPEANFEFTQIQNELSEQLKELTFEVFQEIFEDEGEAIVNYEIEKDLEFSRKILELLHSLTYWDLKCLQGVKNDRSQWRRLLLISDFLANFTDSINAQYDVYEYLVQIYDKCEEEDEAEELFNWISLRVSDLEIAGIPSLLHSMTLLDVDQVWSVLKDRGNADWPKRLEEKILEKYIKDKLCVPVSPIYIHILAQRFVLLVGTEFAKELCSVIHSIKSVADLESLLDTFGNLTKTQLKDVQLGMRSTVQNEVKLPISELKIQIEMNVLMQRIPKDMKRRLRIQRLLTGMLRNGIPMSGISKLMDFTISKAGESKSPLKREERIGAFEHVIGQASQYQIRSILFSQLLSTLESVSSSKFIETTNKFISEGVFDGKSGVKDIHQVITEFRLNNSKQSFKWACLKERFVKAGYSWEILKLKVLQVLHGDKMSEIYIPELDSPKPICDWSKSEVKGWANQAKKNSRPSDMSPNDFYLEALMVTRTAIKLHRGFDLTRVQILCCLVALQKLDKDKGKGQLQQVATGSGKSAIIAILGVIKALEGNSVDIYTSSPVLAERDAKEWSTFYALFDGVTCDHNGDKTADYVGGPKICYTRKIVYGDCSQFQFDYLRDKYSGLKTLAGRTNDFAIVDEVDSMLLDDSSKLARLSSTLPGMDTLEIIYHFIWDRLTYLKNHLVSVQNQYFYIEGKRSSPILYEFAHPTTHELIQIKNLVNYILRGEDLEFAGIYPIIELEEFIRGKLLEYIKELTTNPKLDIKFPKYLKEFVETQAPSWVDSALTALKFEENIHYVVDEDQIKPVDFLTTGIIQSNTNWNNGLHQFLGLKHSLKIYPETLTTNFLSNLSMFEKYGANLMGFTGTLGSSTGRAILYNVYNVKLLTLPETHFKQYIQFPDVVVETEEQWLKEIVISNLAEVSKGRGVLIICETIKTANLISSVFQTFKARVKLYTKNADEEQEKHVERIHPGDIIVATNLAGRGTDIKTLEIEEAGGLHVCLTFLPQSRRIEEQAFGRTSRQGKKGTGQLIIMDQCQYQSEVKGHQEYKSIRDTIEKTTLEQFRDNELSQIRKKGKLFDIFCEYYNQVRVKLLEEHGVVQKTMDFVKTTINEVSFGLTTLKTQELSMFDTLVLQSVEERWAMFLRRVDDPKVTQENAIQLYQEMEGQIRRQFEDGSQNVLVKGSNVFAFIQLGNEEYFYKNIEKANEYFGIASKMDPPFATGALSGLGAVLLLNSSEKEYKENALKYFRDALLLLNTEMAWVTVKQTLVKKQLAEGQDTDTPLFQQLMEKSNLLGYFINIIEGNIGSVEKSLRRVHYTGIKKNGIRAKQETHPIPNYILETKKLEFPKVYKEFDTCRLPFHDLTVREDSGVKDQAVNSLPSDKKCKITCCCKSANLKGLVEDEQDKSVDFLEEAQQLKLQINGLELIKEGDGGGKINFNFDGLKVKIESYDLEIVGVDSDQLMSIGLAIADYYGGGKTNKTVTQLQLTSTEPSTSISLTETIMFNKENTIKIEKKTHLTSIKTLNLTTVAEVGQLVTVVTNCLNPSNRMLPHFNLTLNKLDKTKKTELIESWTSVLGQYNNSSLYISHMSPSQAKKIIPLLRRQAVDFTLEIYDLDISTAANILKNASIEQELMEQTKIQKLSELFMPSRLPLHEILELNARGLCILISFNEKLFIPWKSVLSVCALATVQVAVGGLLITTGFGASLGMSLVTEGLSDFTTAYRAYSSRQFNWSDYRKQKAVSLLISATTLGMSGLKDGAKGLKMLTGGGAAMNYTGQNLQSLAVKYVAVRTVETGARIGLKALADNLANFCFEQLQDTIQKEVGSRVEAAFAEPSFYQVLSQALVIQNLLTDGHGKQKGPSRLKKKIDGIVQATTNPKASTWTSLWDSIGGPLANNILSDPNFVGSSWNTAMLCLGALSGLYQITTIIGKVCEEIQHKLDQARHGDYVTLLKSKGISDQTIATINNQIRKSDGSLEIEKWTDESVFKDKKEIKIFKEFFEKVKSLEQKLKANSSERSLIEKSVVDLITKHIIKTANSHLVSPVLSKFSGQLINSISEELQGRFLVNDDETSREYGSQYPRTLKGQIEGNAKEVMVTINKKEQEELMNEVAERRHQGQSEEGQGQKTSEKVLDLAEGVAKDAPLSSAMLTLAAKNNDQNIKIVSDLNYVATDEERAGGVRVVVYTPPPPGSPSTAPGHFQLKTEDCKGFEDTSRPGETDTDKTNNCGPNIIAHLTGKEPQQVRNDLGKTVLDNPTEFDKLIGNQDWFHSRYPQEANKMMGVGGARKVNEEEGEERRKRSKSATPTRRRSRSNSRQGDGYDGDDENKKPVTHREIYDKEEDGKRIRKTENILPTNHEDGTRTNTRGEKAPLARTLSGTIIYGDKPVQHVQGHGANKQDGGTDDPDNIYIITNSANQKQRQIDDPVREVLDAERDEPVEIKQRITQTSHINQDGLEVVDKLKISYQSEDPAVQQELRDKLEENENFRETKSGWFGTDLINSDKAEIRPCESSETNEIDLLSSEVDELRLNEDSSETK